MDDDTEYRERQRLWHQCNREAHPHVRERERLYSKEYYQINKESVNKTKGEYAKKQRAEHPENFQVKDREKRKRYVAAHKEAVDAYKKTNHVCACGGKYQSSNKSRHF
jgi:hypothetical protein